MSKIDFKNVDMNLVTKYMVEHDCKLDEAIAMVSNQPAPPPTPVVEAEQPKNKLKTARLKAGLSQAELSKLANLKIRTLQAYEQGYKNFDNAKLKTILKVAVACKCKLEDIIEDNEIIELYNMSNSK